MFIAHGEKVRKHARWIMAGILILLVPGFIALFTTTSGRGDARNRDLPTIHGKPIDANEYQSAINDAEAEYIIARGRAPGRTAAVEDDLKRQAVMRLVMLRKAKELGLRVTDSELQGYLQTQNLFLDDAGRFDSDRYQRTMIYLNNFGISALRFEELMRQQLLISRLQALVTTAAKATPDEIALAAAPLTERLTIELVEFNATNPVPAVTVTDADAKAYFETNQERFRLPKRVQVRYALFPFADALKTIKVTDEEIAQYYDRNQTRFTDDKGNPQLLALVKDQIRQTLLQQRADQKAGDSATEFSVQLVQDTTGARPDFTKLAETAGATVHQTDFFSPQGPVDGVQAGPAFRQSAFALGPEVPYSDPVAGTNGYYVLQFLATKPSEIPAFDQVKAAVLAQLKKQRQFEATLKRGQEALAKVKLALAAGKTFAAACADQHITPQKFGPFTLADEKLELPGGMYLRELLLSLPTNTVSDFVRSGAGGLFFHLQDRQPPAPTTDPQDKARVAELVLRQNQQALFNDWVKTVMQQEQVEFSRLRSREPQPPSDDTPEAEPAPAKS